MVGGDNRYSQVSRQDLGNVAQYDGGVNMNDIRVSFFQKFAERQDRQEWDTNLFVGRPFKRCETMNMYFVLNTVDITHTITGCNNPYLVSTVNQVCGKSLRYRGNTTDHRRILITNDHNPHASHPLPIHIVRYT